MICYLVRHDTLRGGWSQQPLTDEGEVQAAELADFVQKSGLGIQQIYSSDLLRAMQTAQIVADSLRLPIAPKPEFREAILRSDHMSARERILAIRLMEKLQSRPDFAKVLGVEVRGEIAPPGAADKKEK